MSTSSPKSLQELHRIREQMTKDYAGLSTHEFVQRIRHEAEAVRKKWKLRLKQRPSPSQAVSR